MPPVTIALRPRDRNRLAASIQPLQRWPFNLATAHGYFLRTFTSDGNVIVRRTRQVQPPFETLVEVTSDGKDSRPALVEELLRERLWLFFHRTEDDDSTDIYQAYSDDDAATWSEPELLFEDAMYPFPVVSPQSGTLLKAGYFSGSLKGVVRRPGDLADSAELTFVDEAGDPLELDDDTFGLAWLPDAQNRLIGTFHIDGESELSEWRCFDAESGTALTWERVS